MTIFGDGDDLYLLIKSIHFPIEIPIEMLLFFFVFQQFIEFLS